MASKAASMAAFKILDRDVDGLITVKDLQKLLDMPLAELSSMVGEGLDLEAFRALLQGYFQEVELRAWSKATFRSQAAKAFSEAV